MSTRVVHGFSPDFGIEISGYYECKIVGYYTPDPALAAAGVENWQFSSTRAEKQVNELLAMRSAFRHWYEREMRSRGIQPEGEYAL